MNMPLLARRFALVLVCAFVVIAGAQRLKGNSLHDALVDGAVWSVISAAVYTVALAYRMRKARQCAVCGDVAPPDAKRDGSS
jgi:hypothetical protein